MKKVPFLVFLFLFCLLFINSQSPSQAVFAQNKFNSFAASKAFEKNHLVMNGEKRFGVKKSSRTNIRKQTALWQQVSEDTLKSKDRSLLTAEKYLVFRLNKTALKELLADVPSEFKEALPEKSVIMELPMPDGTFSRFRIEESSVLEPALAARFPEIKSYRGQGIDNAELTTRFDWTPQGFHALILSGGQIIGLEPASKNDTSLYVSYNGDDAKDGDFSCLVKDFQNLEPGIPELDAPQVAVGSTLRTYRFAIATTFEYTQAYGGGTVAGTVASLNTWLNGATAIYERELSIHFNLVNDTDVIYSADRGFTAATDPYDNVNVVNMLSQVIPDLDTKVGSANYDVGHAFGYTGGASGVAYVGVACNSGFKGGGATQMGGTVGNSSSLGVWVHEIGHQFGAEHNFNGTQGNCNQRNNATSYESGSGSTIMGYSQICSTDNISNSRDMRFHAMSYAAINSYISGGGSCFIGSATGNLPPVVNGGGNRNIPKFTPFTLTATASDANGDSLTYNWEQIDAGMTFVQNGTSPSYNDAGDPSTTTRPIFLPLPSTPSPSRTFPRLILILDYANDPPDISPFTGLKTAEELPRIGRSINFRVTARDNRIGGGGVNEDTVRLSVDGGSGPFLVTAPNTGVNLSGGTAQTVTWSVNNTNTAPVNAVSVKISLSTDGGTTFPTVLTAITPNDGSETVIIPNITTNTARIKVEAVGNIFFDINDTNFAITAGTGGGAQGFEADASPRPNGDGSITSTDVSIIQGFQLGQGLPYQSNEFQRADCAPFDTRGDGRVSSIDVSQAQAYQLGFNNPPQPAAGPTAPSITEPGPSMLADNIFDLKLDYNREAAATAPREVRVVSRSGTAGQNVVVSLNVDAMGDESVYGFSLNYDSTKLSNPVVTIGNAGGSVSSNTTQAGRIGVSVSYGGGTITAGNNQTLVNVQFTIAAGAAAGATPLAFGDQPTFREVASAPGSPSGVQALPTTFTDGTLTINAPTAASVSVSGRLQTSKGRGVANAEITMTDSRGEVRVGRSNSYGYFRFTEVEAGESYVIAVKSKQYRFATQVVNVVEDLEEVNFTALP